MARYFDKYRKERSNKLLLLDHYLNLHKKYPKKRYFVAAAEIYRELEYFDEAVQILKEGLKLHPGFYIGRALLARVYYEMNHFLQATIEAERVVKIDPENLLAIRILMKSYMKLGETQKVREFLHHLLKISVDDPEARRMQGALQKPNKKIEILTKMLTKIQSKKEVSL